MNYSKQNHRTLVLTNFRDTVIEKRYSSNAYKTDPYKTNPDTVLCICTHLSCLPVKLSW